MLEVKKKDTESNEALIRRFTRRVRQSGFILEVKKTQHREVEPNKSELREAALRRKSVRSEKEYLRKIGKLEEIHPGMSNMGSSKNKKKPRS